MGLSRGAAEPGHLRPGQRSTGTATLTVHHEDVEDAVSYAAGWHRHLQYLEAHLRGGDLPVDDFWSGYDDLVELYDEARSRPDV